MNGLDEFIYRFVAVPYYAKNKLVFETSPELMEKLKKLDTTPQGQQVTNDIVNNKLAAFENLTKLKEKVEDEITKKREVESKSVEAKQNAKANVQKFL